ncbi:MAG: hypothetical protein JWN67_4421 [Actinomycetia bacterium]|nr:hypothetical protein [Actinomycetes bacterium]
MLDAEDLVLSLVHLCGDRREFGRTTLQKMAYLSTVALRWQRVGHQAHFYGPFSRPLERTTARLVADGFVEESADDLGFYGAGGYRAKQFHYRLTDAGEMRMKALRGDNPEDVERLEAFVEGVQGVIGGFDQKVLSLAAKVYFIVDGHQSPVTHGQIIERATELGWTISSAQVGQVAELLQKLQLLREKR